MLELIGKVLAVFKDVPLKKQAVIAITVALGYAAFEVAIHPDETLNRIELFTCYWRAVSKNYTIAVDDDTSQALKDIENALERGLKPQLVARGEKMVSEEEASKDAKFNSWTLSQISMALPNVALSYKNNVLARMDLWKQIGGSTFREWINDGSRNIVLTSWAVLAQASALNSNPDLNLINYINDQQDGQGWWGIYENTKGETKYASTYATAISALALIAVMQQNQVTKELRDQCAKSVWLAEAWLRTPRLHDPLWKDYPENTLFGTPRAGLSGLVIYTLHMADEQFSWVEIRAADRVYLRGLQYEKQPVAYAEIAGVSLQETQVDHIRIFVRPCQILGFARAYQSGSYYERACALQWLKQVTGQLYGVRELCQSDPWIAAEYLFALHELQKIRSIPFVSPPEPSS